MSDEFIVRKGRTVQEQQKMKMDVSGLQVGMYVCELDRPWEDTPFLMQGFLLESQDDIDTVADICEHVYIEQVQDAWVPPTTRTADKKPRQPRYINKVDVQQERSVAPGLYKQAKGITKSMLDEVRLGSALNTEKAKEAVNDCVDSILRNPDAMMWLTKIKNKDEYTAEHSLNVCVLAVSFGRHLELSEDELRQIGLCGMLHDVGKMKVPNEILNKEGRLNETEFNIMKQHTVYGRNVLMSEPGVFPGAIDVAYGHHERLNGTGYPRGLSAAGISYFSRIIAIVDTYDAITSDRVYKQGKTSLEALKILNDAKGTLFDPHLVPKFIRCIGLYPPGSVVELNSGEVALVLTTNYKNRRLPKIMIVRDANKEECADTVVDLFKLTGAELNLNMIKKIIRNGAHGVDIQEYQKKGLKIGN